MTACSQSFEVLAPCTSTKTVHVGSPFSVTYTFTNNTLDPLFVAPSAVRPAAVSSCSFSPTSVSVSSHQSKNFTLTCTGGSDGTGTVTVTADEVSATVAVTVESLKITPTGTVVVALPNTVNRQLFTVQNLGATTDLLCGMHWPDDRVVRSLVLLRSARRFGSKDHKRESAVYSIVVFRLVRSFPI